MNYLQAAAARSLGHLCCRSFDFRPVIAAEGAVPALVKLLDSSDKEVQVCNGLSGLELHLATQGRQLCACYHTAGFLP